MRFLANENFPRAAVTALIAAGHDVVWVGDAAPGMSDPDVLAWAARDDWAGNFSVIESGRIRMRPIR